MVDTFHRMALKNVVLPSYDTFYASAYGDGQEPRRVKVSIVYRFLLNIFVLH